MFSFARNALLRLATAATTHPISGQGKTSDELTPITITVDIDRPSHRRPSHAPTPGQRSRGMRRTKNIIAAAYA